MKARKITLVLVGLLLFWLLVPGLFASMILGGGGGGGGGGSNIFNVSGGTQVTNFDGSVSVVNSNTSGSVTAAVLSVATQLAGATNNANLNATAGTIFLASTNFGQFTGSSNLLKNAVNNRGGTFTASSGGGTNGQTGAVLNLLGATTSAGGAISMSAGIATNGLPGASIQVATAGLVTAGGATISAGGSGNTNFSGGSVLINSGGNTAFGAAGAALTVAGAGNGLLGGVSGSGYVAFNSGATSNQVGATFILDDPDSFGNQGSLTILNVNNATINSNNIVLSTSAKNFSATNGNSGFSTLSMSSAGTVTYSENGSNVVLNSVSNFASTNGIILYPGSPTLIGVDGSIVNTGQLNAVSNTLANAGTIISPGTGIGFTNTTPSNLTILVTAPLSNIMLNGRIAPTGMVFAALDSTNSHRIEFSNTTGTTNKIGGSNSNLVHVVNNGATNDILDVGNTVFAPTNATLANSTLINTPTGAQVNLGTNGLGTATGGGISLTNTFLTATNLTIIGNTEAWGNGGVLNFDNWSNIVFSNNVPVRLEQWGSLNGITMNMGTGGTFTYAGSGAFLISTNGNGSAGQVLYSSGGTLGFFANPGGPSTNFSVSAYNTSFTNGGLPSTIYARVSLASAATGSVTNWLIDQTAQVTNSFGLGSIAESVSPTIVLRANANDVLTISNAAGTGASGTITSVSGGP